MREIRAFTYLLYSISGMIGKLKMKDIRLESGVKLNTAAMSLIDVIDRNPGMSVTDIGKRMGLTKSAVSQMLKKLCALGLLKKGRNDGDVKKVYPELTGPGQTTAVEYREKHDRFYACMDGILSRFDKNEQDVIYRFLSLTNENIKEFSLALGMTADQKPDRSKG